MRLSTGELLRSAQARLRRGRSGRHHADRRRQDAPCADRGMYD